MLLVTQQIWKSIQMWPAVVQLVATNVLDCTLICLGKVVKIDC